MTQKNSESATGPRLALISVSDKTGLDTLAEQLIKTGFSLLSTGGTAAYLRAAGFEVTDVSAHTGAPEIMDGRVKTLHPKIHGGILGRAQDQAVMQEQAIDAIEMVVVNLYPFAAVTAREDCTDEEAIENIDIGGPAMIRAAAKNHARVTVVAEPQSYAQVIEDLRAHGKVGKALRRHLATRAYAHTSAYDAMITAYLEAHPATGTETETAPAPGSSHSGVWQRVQSLRYGENPHQSAGFYRNAAAPDALAFEQLQGKELSYNNIADADAALECVNQFTSGPACIIVKHANPCGGALADSALEAYRRAYATDPVSSFGGIISFNTPLDGVTAEHILSNQFVEVIVAPEFTADALSALAAKPNVRVLRSNTSTKQARRLVYHRVAGGMLIQEHDSDPADPGQWRSVGKQQPTEQQWADMAFAWNMVRLVKSNAIVYASGQRTVGIGAGQMSRVDSARIAAWKAQEAGLELTGSVMASDAFFPFRDSIDAAAAAGIAAVIQPGGSMRDDEVIAAADEHGLAMVLTGKRHFRH